MTSAMARETAAAPGIIAAALEHNAAAIDGLAARLRANAPSLIISNARGSSDHAAHFLKYLAEIVLGIPCCSMGASVVSVYGARLQLAGALAVTISQSGASPDICALQREARRAGAITLAIVNDAQSEAAREADLVLTMQAGPETSVAATKTVLASMALAASLIAAWSRDAALTRALDRLPQAISESLDAEWSAAESAIAASRSLYVLGRGPALAIASEAALKLKETCGLHAEACSLAELMHGPLEIAGPEMPALVFAPDDAARQSTEETLARLAATGAPVFLASAQSTSHSLLDSLPMLARAYVMAEAIARAGGRDPDRPRFLTKVTRTQ